jgi:hypothetical protein
MRRRENVSLRANARIAFKSRRHASVAPDRLSGRVVVPGAPVLGFLLCFLYHSGTCEGLQQPLHPRPFH